MSLKLEDRPVNGLAQAQSGVFVPKALELRISRLAGANEFMAVAATELECDTRTPPLYSIIGCALEIIAEEGSRICNELGDLEVRQL